MIERLAGPARLRAHLARHRSLKRASWVAVLASMVASVSAVPPATADSTDSLNAALMAARGVSCAPLRANPIVQKAADEVNDSTDKWLNHASRAIPVPDATPLLKDLGYGGTKSAILVGAGITSADSIKALLLQGYLNIPDCSYLDYGVSSVHNASKDMILTAVVLAA
jgi:hypothetical protein